MFPALFLAKKGMRYAEKVRKKNLVPNSVHTRPGQQNFEKNSKKILKIKKKKLFLVLFLAKTERDRPRKREKKF